MNMVVVERINIISTCKCGKGSGSVKFVGSGTATFALRLLGESSPLKSENQVRNLKLRIS